MLGYVSTLMSIQSAFNDLKRCAISVDSNGDCIDNICGFLRVSLVGDKGLSMRFTISGVIAAFIAIQSPLPALAASATCNGGDPGGVFMTLSVAIGNPSCLSFGNGTVLNTGSDPNLANVLDTTQTGVNGSPTLTTTFTDFFNTEGQFSFDPTSYQNLAIGFQLNDKKLNGRPGDIVNPDYFVFALPNIGSGIFDSDLNLVLFNIFSDPIKYAVLYGELAFANEDIPAHTPIPGALWLFGTVLAGGVGFGRWRKKRKAQSAIAA